MSDVLHADGTSNSAPIKPIGRIYPSIPHLSDSFMGKGDYRCSPDRESICLTDCGPDREVIVSEKLDGSSVGVALIGTEIVPLIRAGYRCIDSPRKMHHEFADWVRSQEIRFRSVLVDGDVVCGELLTFAHAVLYTLNHEPFVVFDILRQRQRIPFDEMHQRAARGSFVTPFVLHRGGALSIAKSLELLGECGAHGASTEAEGMVYRIENDGQFEFMAKYVRPTMQPGRFMPEATGAAAIRIAAFDASREGI